MSITLYPASSSTQDIVALSWTPTGTWIANTTYAATAQIIGGNRLTALVTVTLTGAPTAAAFTMEMPSGYLINTTRHPVGALVTSQGSMLPDGYMIQGIVVDNNTIAFYTVTQGSPMFAYANLITQAVPVTFANGDSLNFFVNCFVTAA